MKLWDLMERPVSDVRSLRRRTLVVALIHLVLAVACVALLVVLTLRAKLLVTLAQRSNVETLVLGFFSAFVVVLLVTTGPATLGAARLLVLRLLSPDRRQRWIQAHCVEKAREEPTLALLNLRVEGPDGRFEVPLEDGFGRLGVLHVRGVELQLEDAPPGVSGPLFELATATLDEAAEMDPHGSPLRLVLWGNVDQSEAEMYRAQVRAFEGLAEALEAAPPWPTAKLDAEALAGLRRTLADAVPYLRESSLMPDVDYSAEFTIPLVPEPLAFVQIRRKESRADPVASLGCATLMVLAALATVVWVILGPPWVPSK
jgi:hypothetical protein